MRAQKVTITNQRGLHARASAKLVKLAAQFEAQIHICKNSECVKATSIMGLMMLAAGKGSEIEIHVEGTDEEVALTALCALIADGFGEAD